MLASSCDGHSRAAAAVTSTEAARIGILAGWASRCCRSSASPSCLILIPGPETAVVTKNALLGARRAGVLSEVGVLIGSPTSR